MTDELCTVAKVLQLSPHDILGAREELRDWLNGWLPKRRTALPRGAKIYFLRAFGLAIGDASSLAGNRRAL